jgi:tRNA 2-selenouridine synthase
VQRPIVLIGGCTGNGKTQLVCSRPDGIDLEGLPTTAALHLAAPCRSSIRRPPLKTTWRSACSKTEQQTRWVLEDEGHMIGANHLPECLRPHGAIAAGGGGRSV